MPAEQPDDVVGQGRDDEPGSPPSRLRRAALVAGAVAVVAVLSRSGLLSSGEPSPPRPRPSASETGVVTATGPRLVARVGDVLVLDARHKDRTGSGLPPGLAADAPLVPVLPGG